MPRRPRMYLPGIPAHVVQRGNNRNAVFFCEDDYHYYLSCIHQMAKRYKVEIHAYVLMTNHVHLLMTPKESNSISRMLQTATSQYVFYINKTYKRTGTLWEGRHKSSLVQNEDYLLKCYRYIELNPVAAGMVRRPDEYLWSSYHANAAGQYNKLITPHLAFTQLDTNDEKRHFFYRELFKSALSEYDLHQIKTATEYNQPLGNHQFKKDIEYALGRKVGQSQRGRPKKPTTGIA